MSVNIYNPTTGDLTTVADSIDSLEKVSALPSATTDLIGKIYLLINEQTGYKKGGIYECQAVEVTPIGTEDPSEEGWYELSGTDYVLSADTTVDSSKTYYTIDWVLISSSGDTNIFNGTLQEWSQLSAEDKANFSHVATPEEADITGVYSTTETKTGSTWIDGKPIYRKVIENIPAGETDTWINAGSLANVGTLLHGMLIASNLTQMTVCLRMSSDTVQVYTDHTSSADGKLVIEYTKTTD